jgi:uroporphyrin-3 C-methyltransferase
VKDETDETVAEDKQNKQENQPAKPAEPAKTAEPDKTAEPATGPAPPGRGNGLAWFALLLAAASLALAGWMYQGLRQGDSGVQTRLQTLSASTQSNSKQLTGLSQVQPQLEKSLQQFRTATSGQLEQLQQSQEQQLQSLQAALQNQRQQLHELRNTDRSDWSLAEAEYLVRLAHQRLLMAEDVKSALALLVGADSIVQELDDAELHPLRAALASDMAALRAVPEFDLEGSWLRIRALTNQVDKLLLFELPELVTETSLPVEDANWQARLEHGMQAAAARLSNYIVIRRRDTPYQPLLDPQWERLVRQNLRMLLEQSQTALLSANSELYQQSLLNAQRWVNEFFAFNEAGVIALDLELEALANLDIRREYPDIGASLAAVKTAVNLRHATADGS